MIDFEPIGEISNPSPPFIGMCNDDDFVTAVDKFLERDEHLAEDGGVRILTVDNW